MSTYHFAQTCFLSGTDLVNLPEVVGYMRDCNPVVQSIEVLDVSGTEMVEDDAVGDPTQVLRVVITGTVESERSNNALHGGLDGYEGSAQDKVDEAAFAYAIGGWDYTFQVLETVSEVPDEPVVVGYDFPYANGETLPQPTRSFTPAEIEAAVQGKGVL